jgi:hypothetical protein
LFFVEREVPFSEFGDRLVTNGDVELLQRVILKMVTVSTWSGADGPTLELFFHGETLDRLFNGEAIQEAARLLPTTLRPLEDIEDLSAENRVNFARANLQAIADGHSQSSG